MIGFKARPISAAAATRSDVQPRTTEPVNWSTIAAAAARDIYPSRDGAVEVTAAAICAVAKNVVPGAMSATIAVGQRRHRSARLLAGTDGAAELLHHLQQRAKGGPTHAALWDDSVVHVVDVDEDARWPLFTQARLGLRSILALRLVAPKSTRTIGALTLYSGAPHAFDGQSLVIAHAFATHAAIALDTATLQQALGHRDVIGQAKGILMERHRITPGPAFDMLVSISQNTNRPLNDVAEHLVLTGALPAA